MKLKITLSVILSIIISCPLAAATIFVAQASAGGNTGANCANARAVSSLAAGDWTAGNAIHLCGTITSSIAAQGNGSSGNVISVIFETGANITVSSCTSCINLNGRSWILIDGSPSATPCGYVSGADVACNGTITCTSVGTGQSNSDCVGVYIRGGTSHIEIRNLNITNLYVKTCIVGGACSDNNATGNYYGVWTDGSNNSIHNIICHDAYGCVKGENGSNNTNINNSQFYNSNWGVFFSGPSSNTSCGITTIQVHDNDLHDYANWDDSFDHDHHDGIAFAGNNGFANGVCQVDIYNNIIHGSLSNCTTVIGPGTNCMTAPIFVNDVTAVRSYNNIIYPANGQFVFNGLIFYWSPSVLNSSDLIANNTVICGTNASGDGAAIDVEGDASMTMQNNIATGCGLFVRYYTVPSTTWTALTNNAYQDSTLTNHWEQCTNGFCNAMNFYSTLAAWQTATSADGSAIAQTSSFNLNASGRPNSGSAVLGAGANLTSLGFTALDTDIGGNARPAPATPWDMGAWFGAASAGAYTIVPNQLGQ